jgi:type IV pilus assembly protein PilV
MGFTLLEVMVAMAIMLVGALGLLTTMNIAMVHNINNQRRDEVVRIAEEIMNGMRSKPFGAVFNQTTTVISPFRSQSVKYIVKRTVTNVSPGVTDRYQVDVRWAYKNYSSLHTIVTIRGN